ncbi:hypothetical protein SPRG_09579 [Saprolegnia parasitica CBS 223.65]|uniref:START domain-containing protein n=1 Tax=Saprolegnia parasitica (strain CBS 223.65) TaxID=695850 RepID=A0A067C6Y9_SAPPC|nr:hypothetical protein SPRG_09579 [Saprolegnia parasitica CBS 223.65]KDO24935.1 hypothetical protein SPRG_09579 [Saprolegnia parasitica CBS 223.65]|eukprot:XP_012204395.1 hypothetical protein SPRG_09579 [Saprolegnia parasitica CBS 223.65]
MVELTLHPGGPTTDELHLARTAFKELIAAVETDSPMHYPPEVATLTATTTLKASLHDICGHFRKAATTGFGLDTTRTELLRTLLPLTEHSFAGSRWSLLPLPIPLVQRRDLRYVEYFDTFITSHGRVGFARALHSVDDDDCMPVRGCLRAKVFASGYVFRECSALAGAYTVTLVLNVDFGGHLPTWAINAGLQARVKHIYTLEGLLAKRRPFRFFLKPRNCSACGDVFCKRCCDERTCTDCRVAVYSPSSLRPSMLDDTMFRSAGRNRLESSRSAYNLRAEAEHLGGAEPSSVPEGRLKSSSVVDLSYLSDFATDGIDV